MKNYTLTNYKGGNILFPKEVWKTEEYLAEHENRFLTDYIVKDDHGRLFHCYRFRTCEPTRFTDTLEYDIECPICHDRLRLCGLPLDSVTHGLYNCPRCDKGAERR